MTPQTSERVLKYDDDMSPVTRTSRTYVSSDLSRNPAAVFDAAGEHPVRVTRRDGDDMVLMSQVEANSREGLLELAAQLIAATTDESGTLPQRLAHHFPWMLALSPTGQEQCATELVAAARASFATGQAHLAVATMTSWRETAIALAAGLGSDPVDWMPVAEPVARP